MKKLLVMSLICALAMAGLCAACCEEQEIRVVTFGHYEQDNDPDNGPEPMRGLHAPAEGHPDPESRPCGRNG